MTLLQEKPQTDERLWQELVLAYLDGKLSDLSYEQVEDKLSEVFKTRAELTEAASWYQNRLGLLQQTQGQSEAEAKLAAASNRLKEIEQTMRDLQKEAIEVREQERQALRICGTDAATIATSLNASRPKWMDEAEAAAKPRQRELREQLDRLQARVDRTRHNHPQRAELQRKLEAKRQEMQTLSEELNAMRARASREAWPLPD